MLSLLACVVFLFCPGISVGNTFEVSKVEEKELGFHHPDDNAYDKYFNQLSEPYRKAQYIRGTREPGDEFLGAWLVTAKRRNFLFYEKADFQDVGGKITSIKVIDTLPNIKGKVVFFSRKGGVGCNHALLHFWSVWGNGFQFLVIFFGYEDNKPPV